MHPAAPSLTINDRYDLLDKLGEGGMGAVYRATDRLTGQQVALKQVTLTHLQSESQVGTFRYALAQEFRVLASLRHPHIISVLDYGFSRNRDPYFTLELLENAQSLVEYGQDKPVAKQVELLIQMLQALAYLHQRGIIHRDLKPGNVMVVNHQVKVLDFGLAHSTQIPDSSPVGTLHYMAPETFAGTPVSVASDLYAVGVMLYELVTGSVPFRSSNNRHALIFKIARSAPDEAPLADHPLCEVVLRLLKKQPGDRYASAYEVMNALCDASGTPRPPESSAIRESFLQAARFVGRETQLRTLREALDQARAGAGSAWLIGGESGVGKSRLLDELRIQALVDGALVLRGQAIAEGGLPYQIWRSAVRRLCLQTDLSDFSASLLKPLVPDIETLLGREVPDVPQEESQSVQQRLLTTIESLFRQQNQLTVLLLEDLHWADESLVLLKRLNRLAAESPLLIIGTYRDDERPTLPDDLPTLRHFKLERLTHDSIEMLSASMLGEVGKSAEVVDLLTRETEGNAFFIVEVVRALAEDAGQLSDIGRHTLPAHVFAGGMRTAIQRRLDKVPESARRLMTIAAVAGRQLDLEILRLLMPGVNLDEWLQDVATVVEVRGNSYRFAHDKLREGILANVTTDDKRFLHGDIARAIERAHPDSPEHYAALAYHWGQAGDAEKTIRCSTLAGEQMLRSGSYREAIRFFERALAVAEREPQPDPRQLSNLYHLIGDANWGQSDALKSREAHIKALRLLGMSVPEKPGQLALRSLKPLTRHVGRRILRLAAESGDAADRLIAARSLYQITQSSYHDANLLLGVFCLLNGIDAAEQAGNSQDALRLKVQFYSSLGFMTGDIALHTISRSYMRLAAKHLKGTSSAETHAWYKFISGITVAGSGQWDEHNRLVEESMQTSREIGNPALWVEAGEFRIYSLFMQSRFADAASIIDGAIEIATRNDYAHVLGRMHVAKARLLYYLGKNDEANQQYFAHQDSIKAAISAGALTVSKTGAHGLLTALHTRCERWDEALTAAAALDDLLTSAPTISYMMGAEASTSIALYLTLWERQRDDQYRRKAHSMLTLFHRKYTRRNPVGQVIEQMLRCWYYWLDGDEKAARKAGAQAVAAAQAFQMPYYEAGAKYHLARFMPPGDPTRADHLEAAAELFYQIEAAYDAEHVLHAIQSVTS